MNPTESLFESPDLWTNNPREAFAAWVTSDAFPKRTTETGARLRRSSATVYLAMFGKFATQVLNTSVTGQERRTLADLKPQDIQTFLDSNRLRSGIRQRYLRLLERTYEHLKTVGFVVGNPARELAKSIPCTEAAANAVKQWIPSGQVQNILDTLPTGQTWRIARNRALVSAILGGGIRPSEAINLVVDAISTPDPDGTLSVFVPAVGVGRAHTTKIAEFAAGPVLEWLALRRGVGIPGSLLFPSNGNGTPMHTATIYRVVRSALSAAGVSTEVAKRRGPRTLRNTFALSQFALGRSTNQVGECLGHRAARSTQHYLDAVPALRELSGHQTPRS